MGSREIGGGTPSNVSLLVRNIGKAQTEPQAKSSRLRNDRFFHQIQSTQAEGSLNAQSQGHRCLGSREVPRCRGCIVSRECTVGNRDFHRYIRTTHRQYWEHCTGAHTRMKAAVMMQHR